MILHLITRTQLLQTQRQPYKIRENPLKNVDILLWVILIQGVAHNGEDVNQVLVLAIFQGFILGEPFQQEVQRFFTSFFKDLHYCFIGKEFQKNKDQIYRRPPNLYDQKLLHDVHQRLKQQRQHVMLLIRQGVNPQLLQQRANYKHNRIEFLDNEEHILGADDLLKNLYEVLEILDPLFHF